jgi:hypothetical protein
MTNDNFSMTIFQWFHRNDAAKAPDPLVMAAHQR